MKTSTTTCFRYFPILLFITLTGLSPTLKAQTPVDGLFMEEGNICNVISYSQDKWDEYWEGSLLRKNPNIGTVTTRSIMYMSALGIKDNLNLIVGLPYIKTHSSAGTLQGRSGIQDLSLNLKWRPLKLEVPFGDLSLIAVAGFSTPLSNYTPDFLPMSIGLHTTNGSLSAILHYQTKPGFFGTVQGGYLRRSNTKIDRTSYYTDRQYYSNEVVVPDAYTFSPRIGYLSSRLLLEVYFNKFYSLSGNDIRRNDMPFPANAMRAESVGAFAQYKLKAVPGLGFNAGIAQTTYGRNVGKGTSFTLGAQFAFAIWKSKAE